MTSDARLANVVAELETVGISCLVMGGHAVRYYGLARNTNDADLHVSPGQWDDLASLLARTSLFAGQAVAEGPSWRPGAFRRFRIGALPDGRDEWLEFWKENHLLPPYDEVRSRAERGWYGGREVTLNPVTHAFLIPFAPDTPTAAPVMPIAPIVLSRLRTTPPAAPLHLALVEIVRRRYIAFRKENDRRDKEAIRARQP